MPLRAGNVLFGDVELDQGEKCERPERITIKDIGYFGEDGRRVFDSTKASPREIQVDVVKHNLQLTFSAAQEAIAQDAHVALQARSGKHMYVHVLKDDKINIDGVDHDAKVLGITMGDAKGLEGLLKDETIMPFLPHAAITEYVVPAVRQQQQREAGPRERLKE